MNHQPLSMISIIMAGGLGKRMSPNKAKVLHEVAGKPMLYHVIQNAHKVGSERILVVVGKYKSEIIASMGKLFPPDILKKIVYITQTEAMLDGVVCSLGTGDAIRTCLSHFTSLKCISKTKVLILSGDVPFIDIGELTAFSKLENALMIANVENPTGYGRTFIDVERQLVRIVEHDLCDAEQLKCNFVNAGIYNLNVELLEQTIPLIELNPKKKEFFLTDFYKHTDKAILCSFLTHVPKNINTMEDLELMNREHGSK